jgi:hypothetical protein
MDIFFNENAIEVLENTDGETRTTILQPALEEVEHDLEVTEPSVHMATLHMMREQLLRVLSRQQLPQREMRGSRRNREASGGEDELVDSLREMHVTRRNQEASGSRRLVNASTTRVESTPPILAREPVHTSQRTSTSKYSIHIEFLKTNIRSFQPSIKLGKENFGRILADPECKEYPPARRVQRAQVGALFETTVLPQTQLHESLYTVVADVPPVQTDTLHTT